ncbi:hypothetical protein GIB67_013828 [Kingdonia uniflora]|uniref:Uncharacterized protein n=1 Tax=Kingdonia uniflora TaxID=39325 RepID=A0A7J7N3F9_9MAGN|nr:hypothetical protein GIB67_013828 [Kingdonia uniflora]
MNIIEIRCVRTTYSNGDKSLEVDFHNFDNNRSCGENNREIYGYTLRDHSTRFPYAEIIVNRQISYIVTTGGAITGFSQLLEYWFYEYCGVGHPIFKEALKITSYSRLKAWVKGNRKKNK